MDAADIIAHRPPSAALAAALEARIADEKIARAIDEALVAVQVERDGTVRPDHKVRLQATQLALHYKHGRPIERQQILTANVGPSDADLIERLAHSPALRAAIREAVDAAEGKTDPK